MDFKNLYIIKEQKHMLTKIKLIIKKEVLNKEEKIELIYILFKNYLKEFKFFLDKTERERAIKENKEFLNNKYDLLFKISKTMKNYFILNGFNNIHKMEILYFDHISYYKSKLYENLLFLENN